MVDTANALRYKDAVMKVIILDMLELERTWISLAHREKGEGCELLGRGFKGFVNKFQNRKALIWLLFVEVLNCGAASKVAKLSVIFVS
jgi:hypothetical protein